MRPYRRVLIAVSVVTVVLAILVALLRDTDGAALLSAVYFIECTMNVLACIYIARLNYQSANGHRLWVLQLMMTTALMGTIGTIPIAFVVARRFLAFPPLDPGEGLLLVGIGLVIATAAPLTKGLVLFFARKEGPEEPEAT